VFLSQRYFLVTLFSALPRSIFALFLLPFHPDAGSPSAVDHRTLSADLGSATVTVSVRDHPPSSAFMTASPATVPQPTPSWTTHPLVRAALVLFLLYVFLVGVNGLGGGFKSLGQGLLDSFFAATENPFMGLMVGILATTLVQSSSVTTSLIVGLVAAPENPLPVANAVPMIMGANIGTTVTNSIAALAHMGRKEEFRRAFSVATCHDFFNYMSVAILLPLELMTGVLQRTASGISSLVTGIGGADYDSPIKGAIKAGGAPITTAVEAVISSPRAAATVLIILNAALIFAALVWLVKVMRSATQTRVEVIVSRVLDRSVLLAMLVGVVLTVMVQSSSITTSLLVPLAGAGVLTLQRAFPITIGANIGTTVTALLAALAATDENAVHGITIALVHLLFNLSGTLLIFPIKRIREIPLSAARWLADTAVVSRKWAIAYVVLLFYGLPALFAFVNSFLK
jgi:sodium-dependent phosphate cotransporter